MKFEVLEMNFPGEGDRALICARAPDIEGSQGTQLVGTVCVSRRGPVAEFARLFVAPGFRRIGIGRHLLTEAEALARAAGCVALSCSVNPKNLHAKLFYSRSGFRVAFSFGDGDLLYTRPIAPLPAVQSTDGFANSSASFCLGGDS